MMQGKIDVRLVFVIGGSFFSTMVIGAYWGRWYFEEGSVPVSHLFGISRWWDILLGPIFSVIFTFLLTNAWVLERILVRPSTTANFFGISLFCPPLLGLVFGLEVGIIACAVLLPLSVLMLHIRLSPLICCARKN